MKALVLALAFLTAGIAQAYNLPYPANHDKVLAQAAALGAPMQAVARAMKEAEGSSYTKKDVIAVIDLSKSTQAKRFFLLDLKAGATKAYLTAHGRGNGDNQKATSFRGFQQTGANKMPLGALKTGAKVYKMEEYETVKDQYNGREYHNLVILDMIGTKSYNSRFHPGDLWAIMHSKWYVTEGYRKANSNGLGRSLGCVVIDPVYSNDVFMRMQGGALIYITVGNAPVENYL